MNATIPAPGPVAAPQPRSVPAVLQQSEARVGLIDLIRSPAGLAAVVFFVDFGVLLALRNWERGDFYVPWGNKTFTIGDSVLLPAYAAFATVAVRQPVSRSTARWWNPASLVGGLGLVAFLDAVAIAQGHSSVLSDPAPSKLYHALIVPFMFWLRGAVAANGLGRARIAPGAPGASCIGWLPGDLRSRIASQRGPHPRCGGLGRRVGRHCLDRVRSGQN